MTEPSEKYSATAIGPLERVRDEESANIGAAGALIADTAAAGSACSRSARAAPPPRRRTWSTGPAGAP